MNTLLNFLQTKYKEQNEQYLQTKKMFDLLEIQLQSIKTLKEATANAIEHMQAIENDYEDYDDFKTPLPNLFRRKLIQEDEWDNETCEPLMYCLFKRAASDEYEYEHEECIVLKHSLFKKNIEVPFSHLQSRMRSDNPAIIDPFLSWKRPKKTEMSEAVRRELERPLHSDPVQQKKQTLREYLRREPLPAEEKILNKNGRFLIG